jgi:hypothetical protein
MLMAKPTGETFQVAFKIATTALADADALAKRWSAEHPGIRVTRTDVLRAAILHGLKHMPIPVADGLASKGKRA